MNQPDKDPDLDRLRQTPVPPPSPAAKARAVERAGAAFAAARFEASAHRSSPPKGVAVWRRLSLDAHPGRWSGIMQNRLMMSSLAAGVLAVPVITAVLVNGTLQKVNIPVRQEALPRDAPSVAARDAPSVAAPPRPAMPRADVPQPKPEQTVAEALPVAPSAVLKDMPESRERESEALQPAPLAQQWVAADAERRPEPPARDRFSSPHKNGVVVTAENPVSTFSVDTDTASYSWVRRSLSQGQLPSPEAVRIEELINYFPYNYPLPERSDEPFRPTIGVYPTPWNASTRLVHVGIKGYDVAPAKRPLANLVFLIDTSGSMADADKLPLVQASLKLLLDRLAADDKVAIVTYAGSAGVALEPTKASDRATIIAAIDRLGAGGSTAGAAGIEEAYALAQRSFVANGVNRVILATDGDFNVGLSDDDSLTRLIEKERQSGIFLSVLGFGQGNYNDALMQRLAQNGNGAAAYIDQLDEAQKVLVDEATSTLFPVAKDVKIQVEFNPATVSEYRLIGYETRLLDRTDFKNDKVDAGEVGSGTTVTALYEITPVGSAARLADDLRYGQDAAATPQAAGEYGFLKIRYKLPNETESRLIEQPISTSLAVKEVADLSDDMRFAAAVAAFGQKLAGSSHTAGMSYDAIIALAEGARGADPWGYRNGLVRLLRLAKSLTPR
jgi:Ca-activated chloride channel family protein